LKTDPAKKLNIAILGYGRMGKEVEKIAMERGHDVVLSFDSQEDWEKYGPQLKFCDVAVEFSQPDAVVHNLQRCFEAGIPVVTGTTGWQDELEGVRAACLHANGTLFYAANYSISVNIFFEINKMLAQLMNPYPEYEVDIEEVHHLNKLDSPSGTAIVLASEIIHFMDRKEKWTGQGRTQEAELEIRSVREENITGTHIVTYDSPIDAIEIKHTAKNRKAFAMGAVQAAEWVIGKKGVFQMKDMLGLK
jgi:4-hydroxy-tetrahydrodipicolinate reductase